MFLVHFLMPVRYLLSMTGGNKIPSVYCLIDGALGTATLMMGFLYQAKNMQVSTLWRKITSNRSTTSSGDESISQPFPAVL